MGDAPNLWTVRADGTGAAPLTDFRTGQIFDLGWERDGKGIVLRQEDRSREVVLITRAE